MKIMAYLIIDKETKRYINEYSTIFFKEDNELLYSSFTGEVSGFMYFTKETAQKIVSKLEQKLHKYNIIKNFEIVEVTSRVPKGEVIYQSIFIIFTTY